MKPKGRAVRRAARQVTEPVALHGEGPVWLEDRGQLAFVDLVAGEILLVGDRASVERHAVGRVAAAFRPNAGGGFVVALERGFGFVSDDWRVETLPPIWSDPNLRMNDGACDPSGRFYCGSMAYDLAPSRGSLYRLEADLSVTAVLSGVSLSNGLWFSLDGLYALFIDSATHEIRRYTVPADGGVWTDYEVVVRVDPELGTPDGLCVDSEDGVWVALWGGGAVHRYTSGGLLTDIVTVPVEHPTACVLGGADARTLWITTSRQAPGGTSPSAGAVFAAPVTVPGVPLARANYGHR